MPADPSAEWDEAAADFDRQPDHGLTEPAVRRAWTGLMRSALPARPCRILDVGCGTGSLSVLLAGLGHRVHGIDVSRGMLALARAKAAGHVPTFARADAARPAVRPATFDVVLARHLVWALGDPAEALRTWADLLAPGGRLALIEGRWSTGAGLDATALRTLVRPLGGVADVRRLDHPAYWGRTVDDERYLLVAHPAG